EYCGHQYRCGQPEAGNRHLPVEPHLNFPDVRKAEEEKEDHLYGICTFQADTGAVAPRLEEDQKTHGKHIDRYDPADIVSLKMACPLARIKKVRQHEIADRSDDGQENAVPVIIVGHLVLEKDIHDRVIPMEKIDGHQHHGQEGYQHRKKREQQFASVALSLVIVIVFAQRDIQAEIQYERKSQDDRDEVIVKAIVILRHESQVYRQQEHTGYLDQYIDAENRKQSFDQNAFPVYGYSLSDRSGDIHLDRFKFTFLAPPERGLPARRQRRDS